MLTLEEIKAALSDRNLREVSRRTGISYANLYAIATGRRDNPTYKVVSKISEYLKKNPSEDSVE